MGFLYLAVLTFCKLHQNTKASKLWILWVRSCCCFMKLLYPQEWNMNKDTENKLTSFKQWGNKTEKASPFYWRGSCLSSFFSFPWWWTGTLWWRSWDSASAAPSGLCLSPSWTLNTSRLSTYSPTFHLVHDKASLSSMEPKNNCHHVVFRCHTKKSVDLPHPGENGQRVVLLLSQVSNVRSHILLLQVKERGVNMCTFCNITDGSGRTFKSRPGRGLMKGTDFSKLEWKRAAETYSAEFNQLLANDTSLDE